MEILDGRTKNGEGWAMRICIAAIWVLVVIRSSGLAATAVYTDRAVFLAAVGGVITERFDGLPASGSLLGGTRSFSVAGISVVASTWSELYTAGRVPEAGSAPDIWLSTEEPEHVIDFDFSGDAVYAVGGYFFTSDNSGVETEGSVEVMTNDLTAHTVTYSAATSFVGFISDEPITRVSVVAVQPGSGPVWPTVNNLVFGPVSAVPEPESAMIQGMVGVAGVMLAWRRKRG
jgi:hypothetical protein